MFGTAGFQACVPKCARRACGKPRVRHFPTFPADQNTSLSPGDKQSRNRKSTKLDETSRTAPEIHEDPLQNIVLGKYGWRIGSSRRSPTHRAPRHLRGDNPRRPSRLGPSVSAASNHDEEPICLLSSWSGQAKLIAIRPRHDLPRPRASRGPSSACAPQQFLSDDHWHRAGPTYVIQKFGSLNQLGRRTSYLEIPVSSAM